MKAYNSDGYKTISVMAFNESAEPIKKIPSGTIVALINPKLLPANSNSEK